MGVGVYPRSILGRAKCCSRGQNWDVQNRMALYIHVIPPTPAPCRAGNGGLCLRWYASPLNAQMGLFAGDRCRAGPSTFDAASDVEETLVVHEAQVPAV